MLWQVPQIEYDVQHGKRALMLYANSEGPDGSDLDILQSNLDILCSSTYITLSIDSVSGQCFPHIE